MANTLRKIVSQELFWIIAVVGALFFFSYAPIVHNILATPKDRFYLGGEEYPLDMTGDLAFVEEGYHGKWLASFNYSTLINAHPSIVKIEYILIGQLARFTRITPLTMFYISRFLLSVFLLTVIYIIIRRIFPARWQRIVSFILVLFAAGIVMPGTVWSFATEAVYDVLVFERVTTAMPHYLLGAGSMLFSLYALSRTLEEPRRVWLFILSLFAGAVSSLVYAPDMVLLVSGFPMYIIFESIAAYRKTSQVKINLTQIGILFSYAIVTLAPVVYVRYIVAYVWKDIATARMEQLYPFHVTPVEYVLAVGVCYVMSFFALPWAIQKGKPLLMLLAAWVFFHPIGEYFFTPLLHINPVRYFFTPYYVAFGILATGSITVCISWIRRILPGVPVGVIAGTFVFIVLGTGFGTYQVNWQRAHICFDCRMTYWDDFGYPKKTIMDGIQWLNGNTKPDDIVLSTYYAGTLIPAFSGNRVFLSWWYRLIEPPAIVATEDFMVKFFSSNLSDDVALQFVREDHIAYVYYSGAEQLFSHQSKPISYPFLKEVYNRSGTVIYKVE